MGINMSSETKELKELRRRIDEMDNKIIDILNARAELALAVRAYKLTNDLPVYDEERENKIFENLERVNDGPLSDGQLKEVYEVILKCMKDFSD